MLFSSGGRGELRSLACRYHKTFRGTLNVQLLRGHNLKVKDNFFNMLGGKDSRPTTYAILQMSKLAPDCVRACSTMGAWTLSSMAAWSRSTCRSQSRRTPARITTKCIDPDAHPCGAQTSKKKCFRDSEVLLPLTTLPCADSPSTWYLRVIT
eukprot:142412-Rhodomonas_salina.2